MNPITHFLFGWVIGGIPVLSRRDRTLVVLASIAPDFDGLGLVGDLVMGRSSEEMVLFDRFHHVLGHNVGFSVAASVVIGALARRRLATGLLAFGAIHLHLLCDLVGARGPDGWQWPIPYLEPLSGAWQLAVGWQWGLDAWPNIAITAILLAITGWMTWRDGFSPLGLISRRADQGLVNTLRRRFGDPG